MKPLYRNRLIIETFHSNRLTNGIAKYDKINLKSINHLNIKLKTVKCLEENIGESICDFWFAKEILDTMPEQSIKDKNS